jgi:Tol biopolymer transport system component
VSDGQLFRRYIDELVSQPIAGTVGSPMSPIFSPDGRWVAYQEGSPRTLKKVPVEGGTPVVVKSGLQGSVSTVSWDGNGILLEDGGLLRVVPDGSQRGERLSLRVPEGRRIRHPIASGDALLFNVDEVGTQTIGLARKGVATTSLAPGYDPRLLPTGHLLWARNGVLLAAGFDLLRGALTTAPAEVVRGVAQAPSGLVPTSYHAVSDNGTLAYIPGVSPDEPKALVARDREGHDRALDAPQRTYLVPRLSPDGTRIALSIDDAGEDIWIWDIRRRALQQVTSGDDVDTYAIWTPDGSSIVYSSTRGARRRLFMRRADGAGEPRLLLDETDTVFANAITRDGRELIYSGGQHAVRVMPLSGGPSRQVTGPLGARSAALSPDDRFIAYQSSESGVSQVYVRPYPEAQRARWQVSTTGGTRPAWSHSGRELFYVNERNQMVSVPIEVRAGELVAGEPKVLFDASDALSAAYRNFDVGLDDQTFILPKGAPVLPSNQIVVVQHWFDELRRLVPLPPH